jgi:hypothetical protein
MKSNKNILKLIHVFVLIVLSIQVVYADDNSLADFISQTQIDGDIRMYDFSRSYGKPDKPSQSAFSLGGSLNLLSAHFLEGFQLGATFYTAQSLGLNSSNHAHVDNTLPGFTVNTLGQAFLQYQNNQWLARIGNQLINTPWLGPADSRMIPVTYQGAYVTYTPITDLTVTGLRITKFKSRTADNFTATNLYNSSNIGGSPIVALENQQNNGALAVGMQYQDNVFNAQVWGYQFYDFAKLFYIDSTYTILSNEIVKPFVSAQFLQEHGDGTNVLAQATNSVVAIKVYGALIGIKGDREQASVGYDHIAQQHGAFNNGAIVSPYTTGYAADPLYTTSMDAGLIEKTAGDAVKFSAMYFVLPHQLQLAASFAKYFTAPVLANTNEMDLDATYFFAGHLKGFTIRDRLGILNGNKAMGRFIYNRVMLQYNF